MRVMVIPLASFATAVGRRAGEALPKNVLLVRENIAAEQDIEYGQERRS